MVFRQTNEVVHYRTNTQSAREKEKKERIYLERNMVFRQTNEVVCRIHFQVYIENQKGERNAAKPLVAKVDS